MYPDYLELLQCLNDNKVRYLIIGGYAVIQYSEPRYTKDLDIWVEASTSNAKRLLKALEKFRAPIDNLTVDELSKPGLVYVFGIPPLRVDIINRAKGSRFKTAWEKREKFDVGGVKANFVSKQILIRLKNALKRPQDLADLEKLRIAK